MTMVNTKFYKLADEALSRECARIESFTDALDKDPAAKKEQIAEYKCAKYRYATVSLIHSSIHNINRCRGLHDMSAFHYLLLPFDELFKQHGDYLALYDAADEADKSDYSLYYAMLAFIGSETAKLDSKLPHASDWETVELTERMGGLKFAKACLDEAWQKRKE
jgi:hypothetical protein